MTDLFKDFRREKDYLVCIDSDGCVMDTMDIKHYRCFGPCMIREWELEPWEKEIQTIWNEINLYTMTRGINRFKGLEITLKEVNRLYKTIDGLKELSVWVQSAPELSNNSLKQYSMQNGSAILKKALKWSEEVNRQIGQLPESKIMPFSGVKNVIQAIHQAADVAIVSSANQQAIMEEWKKHGLLEYTTLVLSQDAGTKAYCISRLIEQGYDKSHVLMVGDAPGDRDAAELNGVLYYPILVRKEADSWKRIQDEALEKFIDGSYLGEYQERLNLEFEENLA